MCLANVYKAGEGSDATAQLETPSLDAHVKLRLAVLASDLDQSIPGLSINRFCASGMEAVNLAANQVKGGAGQAYIAGGVEMMGRVAMG